MSRIGEYMDEDYERYIKEINRDKEWIGRESYSSNNSDRFCKAIGVIIYFFVIIGFIKLFIYIYPKLKETNTITIYIIFIIIFLYFYVCYKKLQE